MFEQLHTHTNTATFKGDHYRYLSNGGKQPETKSEQVNNEENSLEM